MTAPDSEIFSWEDGGRPFLRILTIFFLLLYEAKDTISFPPDFVSSIVFYGILGDIRTFLLWHYLHAFSSTPCLVIMECWSRYCLSLTALIFSISLRSDHVRSSLPFLTLQSEFPFSFLPLQGRNEKRNSKKFKGKGLKWRKYFQQIWKYLKGTYSMWKYIYLSEKPKYKTPFKNILPYQILIFRNT